MFYSIHNVRAERPSPAVFVDRDGTLNVEKNYLFRVEDWEWIAGAKDAMLTLKKSGYMVVVVSNQAGIARGYYSKDDVDRLHSFVQEDLGGAGAAIDAFYFCPHHPEITGECSCRKPAPGMIYAAAKALNIDIEKSYLIGDKASDIEAARRAGMTGILVETGYGKTERGRLAPNQLAVKDVVAAVRLIMGYGSCSSSIGQNR